MANSNFPDPSKAGKLAQQIVNILLNEESVTRLRAIHAAMMLLGETAPQPVNGHALLTDGDVDSSSDADLASFFNRDGETKPSDHAYVCAAYYFSQFGAIAFSTAEIRAIAKNAGVVVPDRLDMTFTQAAKKGKKLFQSAGKGSFKPTATGSIELGKRWNVKPGRRTKPSPAVKSDGDPDAKTR